MKTLPNTRSNHNASCKIHPSPPLCNHLLKSTVALGRAVAVATGLVPLGLLVFLGCLAAHAGLAVQAGLLVPVSLQDLVVLSAPATASIPHFPAVFGLVAASALEKMKNTQYRSIVSVGS
ncbi:hypothetical protein SAY87_013347 [Trapa incisa]|uniref:Uncharacterized protein n=2 Tax=Trapa TaxID=22665 RepID=A0AAN7K9J6_TRANT|nr:hypothetical protein SAY86_008484 [Trapa natans]KAK4763909.1 hypothetical protein SAY87_013347 [Trapa incisa]